tara:strand:- start:969 stop:1889 length:921 start_codon:yes stop_codon:yes gene_type:complete
MTDKIDNDDPYYPWGFYNTEYITWANANRAPNTVASQGSAIKKWITEYLDVDDKLDDIKPEDVSNYINADDGVSLSQRKFRLASVSSFLSLAKARGFCKGNVADKLRVNMKKLSTKQKEKKIKIPFTRKEFKYAQQYLEDMSHRGNNRFWHYATTLSYWTGLRLIDCASMEWNAVMTVPDHLVVWTAKAGDRQHARVALPLSHECLGSGVLADLFNGLLDLYDPEGPDDQLIWPEKEWMMNNVKKRSLLPQEYIRLLKRIGIHDKSFHCLRHSFVTRLRKEGLSLEEIGKLVAHTSEGTTETYDHA